MQTQSCVWQFHLRSRLVSRVALGLMGLSLLTGINTARAQVECGDVIGPREVVDLTADVGPCIESPALTLDDRSTLNLNGFKVTCDPEEGGDGVLMRGNRAQLLGPGTIEGCQEGVLVSGENNRLEGFTSRYHWGSGVNITGNKNRLESISAEDNADEGFSIGAEVTADGDQNRLLWNVATGNGGNGFDVNGDRNTLNNNRAEGNDDDGYDLDGNENELKDNLSLDNGSDGYVMRGRNNRLNRNEARDNGDTGFDVLEGASETTLVNGVSSGHNGPDSFDLADENPDCGTNSWRRNSGTANQACAAR